MLRTISCLLAGLFLIAAAYGQSSAPQTAKEYFDCGLSLLREKKFAEALDAFRSSARLEPNQPATQANIGAALIALRRPAEAAAAFREAIKLSPNEGSFHTALCRALSFSRSPAEAIAACQEGVRLTPDSPDAYAALIDAMIFGKSAAGDLQRLIDLGIARFRSSELMLGKAASYYAQTGNPLYASQLFERLIRINPNSAFYHARLADLYLRLQRDIDAVTEARKALELEPANPFAQYFMGKLFFELGQHEEAEAAFEKVLASGEELPDTRYYLALSQWRRGRTNTAISTIKAAVAETPESYTYNIELGRMLNQESRYEEAIAPLRKAVELDPKSIEAKAGLGLALFESARLGEALPILEDANRQQPGNEVVTMFLNVARSRQQQIPRIEEMKRFARENPQDAKVRAAILEALAYARRLPEAEAFVDEFWKLKPKDVKLILRIAVAYLTAGDLDKALAAYQRSLEVEENPGAYLGMAGIYAKRGQADEASKAYAKVIELKPDVPNIMKLYADHLRDNGRRREALEMYKRSLALLPMNGPALFNAAVLSAKLGESEAAKRYLGPLKTADPQLAKILERYFRLMILQ